MAEHKKYWLNVDRITLKGTLHIEGCRFIDVARRRSKWKGFGHLTKWGGWLEFNSKQEAINYYNEEWKPREFQLSLGCNCIKSRVKIRVVLNDDCPHSTA